MDQILCVSLTILSNTSSFQVYFVYTFIFSLSQCTLITVVCTPNASSNINFTVIILSGNNLTASISWNSNSDVQVSRYIVYVSRSDDPTTYNGTHLYDEEKYKIVSILLTHYHHYLIVHRNPSHPIPITNEVIHISGNIRYSPCPVTCHLVEKARQWEYINLTYLLKDHNSHDQLIAVIGHVLSVTDQKSHRSTGVINDIFTCLQAYTVFIAILLPAEETTQEEATGLAAHSYLILQMSKDLQGSRWPQYDQNFHE